MPPTAPVLNRERQRGANIPSGSMSPQRSDGRFIVSSGQASATGNTGVTLVNVKETSDGDDDEEDDEESDWEP